MKIHICLQFWNLFLLGTSRLHHSNHVKYLLQPVKERERSPTQSSSINKKPTNQRPLLIPLEDEAYPQNTQGGLFNDFKHNSGSGVSGISQTSGSNRFPNLSPGFGSSSTSGSSTFPRSSGSDFHRKLRPSPGHSNSFNSPGFQVPAGYNGSPSSTGFSGSFDSSGSKSKQPPASQFGSSRGSFGVFRPFGSKSGVLTQSGSGFQNPSGSSGSLGSSGFQNPSGSSGSLSSSGFQNPSGLSGSSGSLSSSGFQNPSGLSGSSGSLGSSGFQNPPRSSGSLGSSGFQNPSGSSGSLSSSGFQNPSGLSGSFGSLGSSGFQNPPGYSGSLGSSGFKNPSGLSGSPGSLGSSGFQNPSGLSGSSGSLGSSGFQNPPGYSGSLGSSGFKNPSGLPGSSGSLGSSVYFNPSRPSSFSGHLDPSQTQDSSGFSRPSDSSGVLNQSGFSTFSRPSLSSDFKNSHPKSPALSSGFTSDPSGSHGSSGFDQFPGSFGSRKPLPSSFGVTGSSKFSETHGQPGPFEIPEYTDETDLSFSKFSGPSFNTHFFPTESTTTTTSTTTTSPPPSPRGKRPGLLSPVSKPSVHDSGNSNNIHNPPSNFDSESHDPNKTPNRIPFGISSSSSNKRPLGSFFTPPSSYDIPGKSKEPTIPFSSLLSPASASSSTGHQQPIASVSNAGEGRSKGDTLKEIPNEDSSTDSLEPRWLFSLLCFVVMLHNGL